MSFTRHLLVDGSNLVQAWPDLRALGQRDRAAARAQLVRRLATIHDGEQVRVTIVFDGRGAELAIERPSDELTFSVIHTPSSMTADQVIEQLVANAAVADSCSVATDDNAERECVAAAGASTLRSSDLLAWVRRAEARQEESVAALRTANQREWRRS